MVILLVDDDVGVQLFVWKLLKAYGFTVLNADSGEAALEASRRYIGSIDLLLTDVRLPRMDGLELCKTVAAERPQIRVLLMSGESRNEERVLAHGLRFIEKPFTLRALRNSLEMLLGRIPSPIDDDFVREIA
jgi:DNA-binding response OmpR family regulator